MSDSETSKVFLFDADDPEMQRAIEHARATFGYFWREIAWERRRIVPGLNLACVKAPFSDGDRAEYTDEHPGVEQMWLGEVDFDGESVTGELLNAPQWLKSVKQGDSARFPLGEISDWMYVIGGKVYGAHTVNLLRSRMDGRERHEHDSAWGLDFGDPKKIRLVPRKEGWFRRGNSEEAEHPMSKAMAGSLRDELVKRPSIVTEKDERGWTLLHHEALAGNAEIVAILLESGADPNATTLAGATPTQLAKALGWKKVVMLLASHAAK